MPYHDIGAMAEGQAGRTTISQKVPQGHLLLFLLFGRYSQISTSTVRAIGEFKGYEPMIATWENYARRFVDRCAQTGADRTTRAVEGWRDCEIESWRAGCQLEVKIDGICELRCC